MIPGDKAFDENAAVARGETCVTVSFPCTPYEASLLVALYDILQMWDRRVDELSAPTLDSYAARLDMVIGHAGEAILETQEHRGADAARHRIDLFSEAGERLHHVATDATRSGDDVTDSDIHAPPSQSDEAERPGGDTSAAKRQG